MENLLDKFIRNEKKAKLWAALSLFAFCAVATTVVVVAYKIKNGDPGQGKTIELSQVPDTIFISKEDTATATMINNQAETIRLLTDSFKDLQVKYDVQLQETERYITLWKECQDKPPGGDPPPPPVAQNVSVMVYTVKVSGDNIEKIKGVIYKSAEASNNITVYNAPAPPITQPVAVLKYPVAKYQTVPSTVSKQVNSTMKTQVPPQKYYAGIKYFDAKFANQATIIANNLNSNNGFRYWQTLNVEKSTTPSSKTDIEVWLIAVY